MPPPRRQAHRFPAAPDFRGFRRGAPGASFPTVEKSHGILIRRSPLTETSLIVHWCTLEHGIIRTAARGARRPGSPFAGKLDLFYSADLAWSPSRRSDLHTLRDVSVTSFRHAFRQSWLRVLCASYFVRLIEFTAEPDTPIEGQFHLLQRALQYLETNDPNLTAVLFFERELASILGIHGEPGTPPIAAIGKVYHRIPPQRDPLLLRLTPSGTPAPAPRSAPPRPPGSGA